MEEFVEHDIEPIEKLELFTKNILHLIDVGMEIDFHDQLVESNIEIAKHLVMDDLVATHGNFYVAQHLFVINATKYVKILEYVFKGLHIFFDMELVVASVNSLFVVMDEHLLMKYYVQFTLGCENIDWVSDMYLIVMF